MTEFFKSLQEKIIGAISLALSILCIGVIVQLLLGESLVGWDPVGNIQEAGPSFIGVIAIVALYLLFKKK
ncbi:hypothetical protein N9I30_00095 [Flavobacteriales bacterium]|jgi:hypothetical protein|nr:hypothetical protein [Flavobacteriales bacterium]